MLALSTMIDTIEIYPIKNETYKVKYELIEKINECTKNLNEIKKVEFKNKVITTGSAIVRITSLHTTMIGFTMIPHGIVAINPLVFIGGTFLFFGSIKTLLKMNDLFNEAIDNIPNDYAKKTKLNNKKNKKLRINFK